MGIHAGKAILKKPFQNISNNTHFKHVSVTIYNY